MTATGTCFASGAGLEVTIESTPIRVGSAQADGAGNYSTTIVIPASITPGTHHIVVTGLGRAGNPNHRSTTPIVVLAAQSGGGALVRTGYDVVRVALFAAGLIALGAAFRAGRRRPDGAHFS